MFKDCQGCHLGAALRETAPKCRSDPNIQTLIVFIFSHWVIGQCRKRITYLGTLAEDSQAMRSSTKAMLRPARFEDSMACHSRAKVARHVAWHVARDWLHGSRPWPPTRSGAICEGVVRSSFLSQALAVRQARNINFESVADFVVLMASWQRLQ